MKVKGDHRSIFSNLSNWKEEAWKKSGLPRDSNPWPPWYRCDALSTELWSHTLGARSNYWVHIFPWSEMMWSIYEMIHICTVVVDESEEWSSQNGYVHTKPDKFENATFAAKRDKMFSVHINRFQTVLLSIINIFVRHFGPVVEKGLRITWLLWRQRFQKVPFSLSTLTHLVGVFKFIHFGHRRPRRCLWFTYVTVLHYVLNHLKWFENRPKFNLQ